MVKDVNNTFTFGGRAFDIAVWYVSVAVYMLRCSCASKDKVPVPPTLSVVLIAAAACISLGHAVEERRL